MPTYKEILKEVEKIIISSTGTSEDLRLNLESLLKQVKEILKKLSSYE